MKQTSQRSLPFRQNVNRTEEEWVHFLDGYRKSLSAAGVCPRVEKGDSPHVIISEEGVCPR